MTRKNIIVKSINMGGDYQCVDIFRRPDETFGYELYRRDPEDSRGWYPIGFFGDAVFSSEAAATDSACENVPWLHERL